MKLVSKAAVCVLSVFLALYSCVKPSVEMSDGQDISDSALFKEYIFKLSGADYLDSGDSVMVFLPDSDLCLNSQVINLEEGILMPLKIDNPVGLCSGDTVVVYTPMPESQNSSVVTMFIPSVQNQVGTSFDSGLYPHVSSPFVADSTLRSGRKELAGIITMNPLYAIARFDICIMQHSFVGQDVEYVSFASDGLAGEFKYDLMSTDFEIPTMNVDTVVTKVSGLSMSSPGIVSSVYMALAPGEYSGLVKVKIGDTELSLPVENLILERGCTKPIDVYIQGDIFVGNETFKPSEDFNWE